MIIYIVFFFPVTTINRIMLLAYFLYVNTYTFKVISHIVEVFIQKAVGFKNAVPKQVLPLEREAKTPVIISVAQFRPEKVGILVLSL